MHKVCLVILTNALNNKLAGEVRNKSEEVTKYRMTDSLRSTVKRKRRPLKMEAARAAEMSSVKKPSGSISNVLRHHPHTKAAGEVGVFCLDPTYESLRNCFSLAFLTVQRPGNQK